MNNITVYEIKNLCKVYPANIVKANNNINLIINAGEIFGILGDNGAGKSTLIKQMVNLIKPTSGEFLFLGEKKYDKLVPLNVGYMAQDAGAYHSLTVAEILYFAAHLRGLTRPQALSERDRLLQLWELSPFQKRIPDRLSGGQRRLVQLAVTMAGRPPVLILDEPTNDLDPVKRNLVWKILKTENMEYKTTIIFITHDAIEAEKIIEKVVIMKRGEIVAHGTTSDLRKQLGDYIKIEITFNNYNEDILFDKFIEKNRVDNKLKLKLEKKMVNELLSKIDFSRIYDIKIFTPTLEDIYLNYVNE